MLRGNMLRRRRVRRRMHDRYAFRRYMFSRGVNLNLNYAFKRYMSSRRYAFRRYMFSRGVNLNLKKEYIVAGVGILVSIILYTDMTSVSAYSDDTMFYIGENIDYGYNGEYKIKFSKAIMAESVEEDVSNENVVADTRFANSNYAWPVPEKKNVSSGFGKRGFKASPNHRGIDVSGRGQSGFDIVAVDDGEVTFTGTRGTYGKLVIIKHPDGNETRYAHNSSILVKKGDKVKKGDVVAKMGSTGRSTGPHLHFEILVDGVPIDPLQLLPDYKEVPTKVLYKAKVKDSVPDLNIRRTISHTSSYNILTTIPGGTDVEVLREDEHPNDLDTSIWTLVKTPDGTIGYCKKSFLEKK